MSTTATTFWGTGRRKTSTARVRVREGTGLIEINGKPAEKFFTHENFSRVALRPLATVDLKEKVDVFANVQGGGNTRCSIRHSSATPVGWRSDRISTG